MESVEFKKFANELSDLVIFYTNTTWYFHAEAKLTEESIVNRYKSGWYVDDKATFWVLVNGER